MWKNDLRTVQNNVLHLQIWTKYVDCRHFAKRLEQIYVAIYTLGDNLICTLFETIFFRLSFVEICRLCLWIYDFLFATHSFTNTIQNTIKSRHEIRRAKKFPRCTKNGLFLQLAVEKKMPFLVQLEIFRSFLFCEGFSTAFY